MDRVIGAVLGFGALLLALFLVLFLGGLCSAAWEIHREKKAGKVPTRPAWENRAKRKALGGFAEQIRLAWRQARHRDRLCWCGRGPLLIFPPLGQEPEAWACAAWEAGDPVAIQRHDAAGGYARVPA